MSDTNRDRVSTGEAGATGGETTATDARTDERRAHTDARDRGAMKWLSGIVSLIGLLVAITPFAYDLTQAAFWNNLLVGAAIFLIAGYNFYRMQNGLTASVGAAGLTALLGLWLLVSPFVIEMGAEGVVWNNVVTGLLVALISGYNAYDERRTDTRTAVGERA